jgi:hypothetical protein
MIGIRVEEVSSITNTISLSRNRTLCGDLVMTLTIFIYFTSIFPKPSESIYNSHIRV